jgi:hypothetical protein
VIRVDARAFRSGVDSMSQLNTETKAEVRRAGYGLPCAKCNTYYFADLKECPVCHARERAKLTVSTVKVNPPSTRNPESPRPTEPKLIEINSERRSSPSLIATSKVATTSAAPAEITTQIAVEPQPASTDAIIATVNTPVSEIAIVEAEASKSSTTAADQQRLTITFEPEPVIATAEPAAFVQPGSLVDCWAIIMGRDRTVTPTPKPAPPKEIAADDFSARCVKMLEEIYVSGETVVITSMGRPVAKVVPIEDETFKPTGS